MVRGNLPSNDHVALLSNQLVARISGLPDHHIRLALLCRGLHLFSHAARDHAGRHHRTGRCDFLRHGLVESAIHLLSGQCGATRHGALCAFVAFLPETIYAVAALTALLSLVEWVMQYLWATNPELFPAGYNAHVKLPIVTDNAFMSAVFGAGFIGSAWGWCSSATDRRAERT